jgi:hypothetical protein
MRTSFPRFRASAPRPWLAALLLAFLAGCMGDAVSPDQAARLRPVAGADQVALVGEAVEAPLQVRVEDDAGNPVRGAVVEWRVAGGGGTLDQARTETDGDGMASVRWTLGSAVGEQQVEARVTGALPLVFGATATEIAEFQVTPRHVRLSAVGEEQVLRLMTRGTEGDDVASGVVTWRSSDPDIVSVFGGRVRAMATGSTTLIVLSDGTADTVLVSVGASATAPVAVTGQGQQRTSASQVTLAGTVAGNGYAGEAWLEWGRQPTLSDAAEMARAPLAATGTRGVSGSVTGLSLNETLYFRAVAQTSQGITRSDIVSYTVAAPAQPTGLAGTIGAANYLLKLTWTVPARGYSYATERREPGETTWTSSPLYTSNTGGYWAYYPHLQQTRSVEFRVRSCNAVGCTYSDVIQVVIPRIEPPSGLAGAVTDSGHVRLTWTDGPYETFYGVYRRVQGNPDPPRFLGNASTNVTTYTDRDVLPGVTYLYHVISTLTFGGRQSAPSGEVAVTPGGGETYPPTVTTLDGLQPTYAHTANLRGQASGNHFAGRVWIEWGRQPDLSDAAVIGRDTLPAEGVKAITGAVTGLVAGSTLYFRAVAENRYATVRGAILSYTVAVPALPTGLQSDFNPPSFRLNLNWTQGARTASHFVEQRVQGDTAWRTSNRIWTPAGTYSEYPPMLETRTVEYRIRACNGVGCVYSAPVAQLLPRLEPPQNFNATVNAAKDVVLTWSSYPTATSFNLYRRVQGGSSPEILIAQRTRSAVTYTDTSALEGVTYAYTARSVMSVGSRISVPSVERVVTPGNPTTYPPTATTGTAIQPIDEVQEPQPGVALLRGTATGNNFAGHVWFEYGSSPTLAGATVVGRDTLPATGTRTLQKYVGGLAQGSTFYYRMVAENRYGTVRGAISSYTVAAPEAPTGLRVEYGPANYLMKLYWTVNARSAGYAVEFRDQGTLDWTNSGIYTSSIGGYTAFYPRLDHTRVVEMRVLSCNAVGCTPGSAVTQLVQRFDPPAGVSGSVNGAGDVVLAWTDGTMETSYEIMRQVQGSGAAPVKVGSALRNAVTFTDTTALSGVTYVYTVHSLLSFGTRRSAASNPAVVAVP